MEFVDYLEVGAGQSQIELVGYPIDTELDSFTLRGWNTTTVESANWVRLVSSVDDFEKGLIFAIEPSFEAAGANFTITFTLAEI